MTAPLALSVLAVGLLATLAAAPVLAQPELLGRVLDPVDCAATPTQRYVLYVPSYYTRERRWPAVFCFDAGARGRLPVERLQAAAERYGYIIAGSLNSRNGPLGDNVAAAAAMMKDVSAHFSIDPQRVSTTGVSGGARVAIAIALSGVSHGVIACAAGFPVLPGGMPARVPFPVFGTTGTEDFNHGELRRLDDELESRHSPHRIVVFAGGHEWASPALMTEGIEWLELQAMRNGLRARDDAFIHSQFAQRRAAVPDESGPARWRALLGLVADFDPLVDVTAFRTEAKALGASREVKAGLKAERALAARENEMLERLGNVALESAARRHRAVADLRTQSEALADGTERQLVRRVIAGFTAMTGETVRDLFDKDELDRATALLEMAVEFRPEQPRFWFDLARARARLGELPDALAALRRAADAGFSSGARLEAEAAFSELKSDPAFREIVAQVRARNAAPGAATPVETIPAPSPSPAKAIPRANGVLQLPVLRVFAALAHVEVRSIHLPNARPDLASAVPAVLSHLRVESVRPHTPADFAGLKPDMEITSVQGRRIRGMSDDELSEVLARPAGSEIALLVRDQPGGRERELHIPLRPRADSLP